MTMSGGPPPRPAAPLPGRSVSASGHVQRPYRRRWAVWIVGTVVFGTSFVVAAVVGVVPAPAAAALLAAGSAGFGVGMILASWRRRAPAAAAEQLAAEQPAAAAEQLAAGPPDTASTNRGGPRSRMLALGAGSLLAALAAAASGIAVIV